MPEFIVNVDLPISERELSDAINKTWLKGHVQIESRPTPLAADLPYGFESHGPSCHCDKCKTKAVYPGPASR